MSTDQELWKTWFSEHSEEVFRDYFHFLRFKSIGADPAFKNETLACAKWLEKYLAGIGLDVQSWQTSSFPVIFAEKKGGESRPTLLLYHHYDVQPVDPLELWESDPFEPTLKGDEVYARGAQDNKGQCFYSITAVRALLELNKKLNFNLKLFIEGEEEHGSLGTLEALEQHKKDLKSDYLLVVDTSIPGPEIPSIALGVRGILTMNVICRTANDDMHSGGFGGIAYNPIRVLARAFDRCWDQEGKVAVPHFYDRVAELSAEDQKELSFEMDEEMMKREFGLRAFCPEPGYSIGESVAARPTLEINGISGGYAGEGFKTVLPAVASAKVSCRLVPDQDPEEIFSLVKKHLQANVPEGVELEVQWDSGAAAFRSSGKSNIAKVAAKGYEEVLKQPCKKILVGGSIPIVTELAKVADAETLVIGYGLDTDQIHAPNEHFGLDRFEQGFLTLGNIFKQLDEQH
jgi:acetylornithine deacetylase/succinyl-diaminopimelate desuccinylase-like protein